jgi:hypothetical protein
MVDEINCFPCWIYDFSTESPVQWLKFVPKFQREFAASASSGLIKIPKRYSSVHKCVARYVKTVDKCVDK